MRFPIPVIASASEAIQESQETGSRRRFTPRDDGDTIGTHTVIASACDDETAINQA